MQKLRLQFLVEEDEKAHRFRPEIVKEMAEHGRISLRTIRREGNEKVKKLQHDHTISEDDSFRAQEDIQKLTDGYIKQVDAVLSAKNKELLEFN